MFNIWANDPATGALWEQLFQEKINASKSNLVGSGERSNTQVSDNISTINQIMEAIKANADPNKITDKTLLKIKKLMHLSYKNIEDEQLENRGSSTKTKIDEPISFFFNMKFADGSVKTAYIPVHRGETVPDILKRIDMKFALSEHERVKLVMDLGIAISKTKNGDVSADVPMFHFNVKVFEGLPNGLLNFLDD